MARLLLAVLLGAATPTHADAASIVTTDLSAAGARQTIDGFGAHQGSDTNASESEWFRSLFFDDLRCSIYRVDLSPALRSPYSDQSYWSPNFGGRGALALPGLCLCLCLFPVSVSVLYTCVARPRPEQRSCIHERQRLHAAVCWCPSQNRRDGAEYC